MAFGLAAATAGLAERAKGELPLVERMRIEAARRLAYDEELDEIERELRSDLHGRGGLSWDTARRFLQLPLPPHPSELWPSATAAAAAEAAAAAPLRPEATLPVPPPPSAPVSWPSQEPPLPPRPLPPRRPPGGSSAAAGASGAGNTEEAPPAAEDPPSAPTAPMGSSAAAPAAADAAPAAAAASTAGAEGATAGAEGGTAAAAASAEAVAPPASAVEARELLEPRPLPAPRRREGLDPQGVEEPPLPPWFLPDPRAPGTGPGGWEGDFREPSLLVQTLPPALGSICQRDQWKVVSQEAWQLGKERCTLTTISNEEDGLLRFELLKYSTADTLFVTCTRQQFLKVCEEQAEPPGAERVAAAVHQLFREVCG